MCFIKDGQWGSCRSRKNFAGVLFAVNFGRTVSMNLDPIEKKPLYHYHPGSQVLSLGPNSCNLHCDFCQNYEISQEHCLTTVIQPDQLLDILLRKGITQVAFTYTEPFTWFEYILECGKLFQDKGIRIVLVTNGYINREPLVEILPYIDAMNIDLKSMDEDFYSKACKGKRQPILDTIIASAASCHIELTNLLIPGLNDACDDIRKLVDFVNNLNPEVPLHFSRYYPHWKCHQPITPEATLFKAYELAMKKLKFVYLGNISSGEHSDTHCPNCKRLLVSRGFLSVDTHNLRGNHCSNCNSGIYGRF